MLSASLISLTPILRDSYHLPLATCLLLLLLLLPTTTPNQAVALHPTHFNVGHASTASKAIATKARLDGEVAQLQGEVAQLEGQVASLRQAR